MAVHGDVMVIVLANEPKTHGFKTGRERDREKSVTLLTLKGK
jgi:hypothetical protein